MGKGQPGAGARSPGAAGQALILGGGTQAGVVAWGPSSGSCTCLPGPLPQSGSRNGLVPLFILKSLAFPSQSQQALSNSCQLSPLSRAKGEPNGFLIAWAVSQPPLGCHAMFCGMLAICFLQWPCLHTQCTHSSTGAHRKGSLGWPCDCRSLRGLLPGLPPPH